MVRGDASSPGSAIFTRTETLVLSHEAKPGRNPWAMCWTTSTGTGKLPGSSDNTWLSAAGPPVEAATASTRGRACAEAGRGGGRGTGRLGQCRTTLTCDMAFTVL